MKVSINCVEAALQVHSERECKKKKKRSQDPKQSS